MLADSRVKSADWTRSTLGYADGFAPVEIQRPQKTEDEEDDGMFSTSVVVSETMSGSGQATNQQPNMTLLGLLSPQLNKLADETWKLAQGRMITQEEIDNGSPVAVIDKRLAEANNLSVGDFIRIKLYSDDEINAVADTANDNVLELEIVGILDSAEELSSEELPMGQRIFPSGQSGADAAAIVRTARHRADGAVPSSQPESGRSQAGRL